jgi:hypothetical protein
MAGHPIPSRNSNNPLQRSELDSSNPSAVGAVSSVAAKPKSPPQGLSLPQNTFAYDLQNSGTYAYAEVKTPMPVPSISLSPPSIQGELSDFAINATVSDVDHTDFENEPFGQVDVTTPNELFIEDDEGLSALEKVYLFSRSDASFHRWVLLS